MTNAPEHKLLAFAAVVPASDAGRSPEFSSRPATVEPEAVSLHLMPAGQEVRPWPLQHL